MSVREVTEAIHAYHAILDHDSSIAEDSAIRLAAEQPAAHLTFGGRPLCSVLRPHFLTASVYRRIQHVSSLLASAMFRLAEEIPENPELLEPLHLTPVEQEMIAVDPGFRPVSPTTRLDSFMTADSLHFVEYNAETPAAIAYQDALSELFQQLPVMQEFSRQYEITLLPARDKLLAALLDAYRQWGGQADPTIAIVDWSGVPTATEFELFKEYFELFGLQTVIVRPDELAYDGKRLRARGEPIDLVYRRVLTSELLAHPDVARPLIEAYKNHHVCVANSFRAKLLHKKMIFALLSDDRYAHHFSLEELGAIAEHVPWTREVREGYSTHQGERVDLLPFIQENRERLVLKPNDEYGGKGVVIGWESSPSEWDAAVGAATRVPSVVQERVPIERETFPIWKDGKLHWVDLSVDLDPYIFGSEVTGVLTRLSAAALLNVTAGTGSMAPTILVRQK